MGQYDIVNWRGEPVTIRMRQAYLATERYIREKRYPNFEFQIPQGCNQPSTPYSGYTHTRLGVSDLQYYGFYGDVGYSTKEEKEKARFVLRALREVGHQAAFMRGPWSKTRFDTNGMILHFHVLDLDTFRMHPDGIWQVGEYRQGNDGLISGRRDRFVYRPKPMNKWKYRK
jgi:hypothetical protein